MSYSPLHCISLCSTVSFPSCYPFQPFLLSRFHRPSSLPTVSLSISPCFCVCIYVQYVGYTLYTGVCMHTGACGSIIECPRCRHATSQPHIPVIYVVFPADPLSPSVLLTPLIYHSSSVFTFYLLSLSHSDCPPFPFHVFFSASFPSSYYSLSLCHFSSLVYLSLLPSLPLLCQLICFCSSIFLSMLSFTLFPHCISCLFLLLSLCSHFLSLVLFLSVSSALSLSLVLLICFCRSPFTFCFFFSPFHLIFMLLICCFLSRTPPPLSIYLYISYCLALSHPSPLFLSPSFPCSLWKSSPYLSLLSPLFLRRARPSLTRSILNRIPPFSFSFFLYTPGPLFPLSTIYLHLSFAKTALFVILSLCFLYLDAIFSFAFSLLFSIYLSVVSFSICVHCFHIFRVHICILQVVSQTHSLFSVIIFFPLVSQLVVYQSLLVLRVPVEYDMPVCAHIRILYADICELRVLISVMCVSVQIRPCLHRLRLTFV